MGKKTGQRWGARTRRCPCLPHLVWKINDQRSTNVPHHTRDSGLKISRPERTLSCQDALHSVTRSIEEQQSTGPLAQKPAISTLFPSQSHTIPNRRDSKLFGSRHHPHSHLFQTVRMSRPEGKRPYISIQWPLVFSGPKGNTCSSSFTSFTARIDGSVRSKRGAFFHDHLPSRWDVLPLRCTLKRGFQDTMDQQTSNRGSHQHQVLPCDED